MTGKGCASTNDIGDVHTPTQVRSLQCMERADFFLVIMDSKRFRTLVCKYAVFVGLLLRKDDYGQNHFQRVKMQ